MLSLQKTMLPFSNLKNKESAKSVMLFPLGISSFGGLVSNIAGPNASFSWRKSAYSGCSQVITKILCAGGALKTSDSHIQTFALLCRILQIVSDGVLYTDLHCSLYLILSSLVFQNVQ